MVYLPCHLWQPYRGRCPELAYEHAGSRVGSTTGVLRGGGCGLAVCGGLVCAACGRCQRQEAA